MIMKEGCHISVTLTPEVRLEQALKEAGVKDPATITHLNIAGTYTDEDEEYMEKNFGENLQEVDFSDCTALSTFMQDCFEKDNTHILKEKHGYIPIQEFAKTTSRIEQTNNRIDINRYTYKRAIVIGRGLIYIFHFPQT